MAPIRCCFDQTAVWHSDAARGPSTPSFDHLVGASEEGRWYVKAERPRSLEVDHELELGPLLHRQVGWFCPIEDFVDEAGRAVPHVFNASRIGEQATRLVHLPHS